MKYGPIIGVEIHIVFGLELIYLKRCDFVMDVGFFLCVDFVHDIFGN